MIRLFVVLAALLLPAAAHADTFGYVDINRVYQEASEPARAIAALNAEQAQVAKAREAADKSLLPHSAKSDADAQLRVYQQHQQDTAAALQARLAPILAKLKAEHRFADILPVVPLTPTKADLTDELIRRWNALDVQANAEENARLRAQVAALQAKTAAPAPAAQVPPKK